MKKNDNPCFNCQNRRPGCHGGCEKYIEWKAGYQASKDKIKEERERIQRMYPAKARSKYRKKLNSEV